MLPSRETQEQDAGSILQGRGDPKARYRTSQAEGSLYPWRAGGLGEGEGLGPERGCSEPRRDCRGESCFDRIGQNGTGGIQAGGICEDPRSVHLKGEAEGDRSET